LERIFSTIFYIVIFNEEKQLVYGFMHFDLHFVAFDGYSVKDITVLNHWVGVIVFARWCSVFILLYLFYFWI